MQRSMQFLVLATLLLTAAAIKDLSASNADTLQLAYNPTYEIWFFLPKGRPKPEQLTDSVQRAYYEHRPGGVCFKPDNNNWFYCSSGIAIE
ncbi:CG4783 [Drosophila busckii]|uniref:CG4783 n=1 Tax=Drosophila busckii TaxID=30019 RepID=A0A0M4ERU8_DROBS|nr:uncharacterized protein LOC108603936 [Drosophila busckii]ALC47322.1 CG4783 [Drosophila busckii]